ncbi:hypothetical protein P280DRAFT_535137 [Massarina eburnea CBS 473.64]|uniref:RING-type domain-containing protein n=1 Tax=Massarina eburnea CBS 473.64 TaxID=1395130 RepID=A0A6A6SED8_9PLEO|nr:hypothetical protein P280DRAFT_535137 [Massarina eburnea CBS 473.64]
MPLVVTSDIRRIVQANSLIKVSPAPSDACPICLNTLSDPSFESGVSRLKLCGHIFHNDCILTWVNNERHTCPLCRGELTERLGRQVIYEAARPRAVARPRRHSPPPSSIAPSTFIGPRLSPTGPPLEPPAEQMVTRSRMSTYQETGQLPPRDHRAQSSRPEEDVQRPAGADPSEN